MRDEGGRGRGSDGGTQKKECEMKGGGQRKKGGGPERRRGRRRPVGNGGRRRRRWRREEREGCESGVKEARAGGARGRARQDGASRGLKWGGGGEQKIVRTLQFDAVSL